MMLNRKSQSGGILVLLLGILLLVTVLGGGTAYYIYSDYKISRAAVLTEQAGQAADAGAVFMEKQLADYWLLNGVPAEPPGSIEPPKQRFWLSESDNIGFYILSPLWLHRHSEQEWVYRGRVTGFAQNSKVNLELDWAYTFAAAPDEGEAEDSGDESIQEEKPAPGYVMNAGCLLRYRIIESW